MNWFEDVQAKRQGKKKSYLKIYTYTRKSLYGRYMIHNKLAEDKAEKGSIHWEGGETITGVGR